MKKLLALLTLLTLTLVGCDSPTGPTLDTQEVAKVDTVKKDTVNVDTAKVDTVKKDTAKVNATLTCLSKYRQGTYAYFRNTGIKVNLDSKGCFETVVPPRFEGAARSASINDTIIFKNDSALFSLTIPFNSLGDTIDMVQTDVAIRGIKNDSYDSVTAIVFDRKHIKERKANMRKAYSSSKTDWSIKFYSPVNGNDFLIHFEYHKGAKKWTSELITAEVGSSFNGDSTLAEGSVPSPVDTIGLKEYGSDSVFTVKATSIYGISSYKIDGKDGNTVTDTAWGVNKHTVTVVDSAGYSNTFEYNVINGHFIPDSLIVKSLPPRYVGQMYVETYSYIIKGDAGITAIVDGTNYSVYWNLIKLNVSDYRTQSIGKNEVGYTLNNRFNVPFIY